MRFAALLAAATTAVALGAHAQVGVAVSAQTSEVVRGLSLSDGHPVASLELSWDGPAGVYAGGSVISVASVEGPRLLGWTGWAGWAVRAGTGLTLDFGATGARYSAPDGENYAVSYAELYGGAIWRGLSAHLHYSPDYFSQGAQTLYLDLDGSVRPARRWRVSGHVGLLHAIGTPRAYFDDRLYADFKARLSYDIGSCELGLAWATVTPQPYYANGYPHGGQTLVASVTYGF